MEARELMKKLALHPVTQTSMTLGMQLGLPWLEKKKGMLLLSFKPHKETYESDGVAFYPQQYEITWAYPFTKIVLFRDLTMESEIDAHTPICIIGHDRMLSSVKYRLNELYGECTQVLTVWDEKGEVPDAMLRSYQKKSRETIELLGLEALYD